MLWRNSIKVENIKLIGRLKLIFEDYIQKMRVQINELTNLRDIIK